MYDVSATLKSLNDMLKSLLDYLKISKEKQADSDLLSDKKSLKKASNVAEEIINNTDGLFSWVTALCWDIMSRNQRRQYLHFMKKHKKFKKQFEKVN